KQPPIMDRLDPAQERALGIRRRSEDHLPRGVVMTTTDTQPLVSSWQLRKRFGDLEVLKSVTFEIARGEVVCLMGPSGSGKSTLLRCVNQLETIDGGFMRVGDHLIGWYPQDGRLHQLS